MANPARLKPLYAWRSPFRSRYLDVTGDNEDRRRNAGAVAAAVESLANRAGAAPLRAWVGIGADPALPQTAAPSLTSDIGVPLCGA